MPVVDVAAVGGARKLLGFSRRSIEVSDETVASLLQRMETLDGKHLYDHVTCEGRLRGDFAVMVDGLSLNSDQLQRPLRGGEQIVTMEIIRHLHGG
jgi:hypothetical protein